MKWGLHVGGSFLLWLFLLFLEMTDKVLDILNMLWYYYDIEGNEKLERRKNTMIKHIMNFKNNDMMSRAAYALDTFTKIESVEEDEFNGDDLYEVYFTTTKPLPQTVINRIKKYADPIKSKFNY